MTEAENALDGIAIVGMAGRFPGADDIAQFWSNLKNGVESITRFRIEDLDVADRAKAVNDPAYVLARGVVNRPELFDASFFGIYPQEAIQMDPQHRIFLECCWEALEDAAIDVSREEGLVGVFAGCTQSSYLLTQVNSGGGFLRDYAESYPVGQYPVLFGNIPDTLATRVSYKLNLRGPSISMMTACSTSLTAVSQAVMNLMTYSCDVALAGGVSITFPQQRGYLYQQGGMVSSDGRCRTFDKDAQGTVFSAGSGVVVLKRLGDALASKDHIYAVIKGCGVNNDGSGKVGYTAPSTRGQVEAIAMAHAAAGVEARSISYVEAHGTATPLGDPIEVAALTQVFRDQTQDQGFCALGSVKPNIGHLDAAAGVTGLIKTALALRHRQIPPTLHFEQPNPELKLEGSPFYVAAKLEDWKSTDGGPLRAGVSAFGVGGTNVHVVLEEAPEVKSALPQRNKQLILLSAKSGAALSEMGRRLSAHLSSGDAVALADAAYTLQMGRGEFEHRTFVVASTAADAAKALEAPLNIVQAAANPPEVHFFFPGQGTQKPGMGLELYRQEPIYRSIVDRCAEILKPELGLDLRDILYPADPESEAAQVKLNGTEYAQPAIFITSYATAMLWKHWGIEPKLMAGHSVGEFVCACLAGVFSFEDALRLIARRGRLMGQLPGGAMLSVRLPKDELTGMLSGGLAIASVNAPRLCVASGPYDEIASLEKLLEAGGVGHRRLHTSHAFHSPMIEPIVEELAAEFSRVRLSAPQAPFLSCVTGMMISAAEAVDPRYWARHARATVEFSRCLEHLRQQSGDVLLEAGPGTTLQTLARQHLSATPQAIVSSLDSPAGEGAIYQAAGALWQAGVKFDWMKFQDGTERRRVPLPTYPFERKAYWAGREPGQPIAIDSTPIAVQITKETKDFAMTEQLTISGPDPKRLDRLRAELILIFQELSGMDADQIVPSAAFLQLGFDSLFLTQVTQSLQSKYKVKVTLRQLLSDLSSLDHLAAHLDEKLPAEVAPPAAPVVATSKPVVSAAPSWNIPGGMGAAQQLMNEQLRVMTELMNRQLEVLRMTGGAEVVVPSPAPQPAAPAPAKPEPEYKAHGPYKPIQTQSGPELNEKQTQHIADLIARYNAKTAGSKAYTQRYRKVLADPRVVSGFRQQWKDLVYPIVTNRSEGSKLYDIDGNEYVDLLNGFGPIALGHRPEFLVKAIEEQLRQGIEIGPQTPLAGEAAELLCELTGMERATFCNTGSEAVMAAMRLARTVTARSKVVMFAGDYHGNFEEALAKRIGRGDSIRSGPIAPGIAPEAVANVVILDYGSPEALEYIRRNADELAAVMVEPVQSRHPELRPAAFLREVREITAKSGTALIFDEVVTGFRIHQGGAQAYYGIRADLATYGKVLGGGFPIGALAGSATFMDALDGGMWSYGDDSYPEVGVTFFAGTFVRHPLAMAAALSVLRHLKTMGPSLQENLARRTEAMVARLNEKFTRYGVPSRIETCASWFFFSFPADFRYGTLLYYHLREKGIHIQEGFPCFLTTAHSDADVERIEQAFEDSLRSMSEADLLPEGMAKLAAEAFMQAEPGRAPLTEAQLEIWLSTQLTPEAACAYNESFRVELSGNLNEDALKQSVLKIANRHQIFRARFDALEPQMIFEPRLDLEVPTIDLSAMDRSSADAALRDLIAEEARTPFDLLAGRPLRIRLVKLDTTHHHLVWTSHHIVCDGWSTNVLVEELSKEYSARVAGGTSDLPPALAFGRYAIQQRKDAESAEQGKVAEYWMKQFAHPSPVLELPTDRPRPAVKSFAGATLTHLIDKVAYGRLKQAGAKQGATMFALMLAGFNALLFRLTNQDDVVVGIPAAAQSLLDGETLVGHCVNFLALRSQLSDGESFEQLLAATKTTLLDAYDHQTYTYGTLVRKLGIQRNASRLPLIEVQFNLERLGGRAHFTGLDAQVQSNPKAAVNFDIFFNVVESETGLKIDCDYNTDLFDEQTIARWLTYYEQLLSEAAANIHRPVVSIPLLLPAQREEILRSGSRSGDAYPLHQRITQLFEAQAFKTPSRVAVVYGKDQITYDSLERRANQLAHALRAHGVNHQDKVAIFLDRSVRMPEALLAVLKCGAVYVPLDPMLPKDRVVYILQETRAKVVLTDEADAGFLSGIESKIVCIDSAPLTTPETRFDEPAATPSDLAYVIYTSGSTGKPKGVEISHRSVANFLWSMLQEPGLKEDDRLLAVTTLSFDIAGLEMFLPLIVGARVVIASREATADGHLLRDLIEDEGITALQATPATWRLLLEAGWQPTPRLKMMCGGEALPRALANQLTLVEGAELWNMYGPTETTIWSAVSRVENGSGLVSIGRPIANTQFYVLDAHGELTPPGVPGELVIGGDGVARGYYERPELTAARFSNDPFRPGTGNRVYKTGDLVRRLADGTLEFLGRLDHQVKVRGFRIELGEIEALILSYPGVREAVVTVNESKAGDPRLVAYVAIPETLMPSFDQWRELLARQLPAYMIPSHFVRLDELPKTPNGKIDRKQLPAPQQIEVERRTPYKQPSTEQEIALAKICAEVLGIEKVGVNDNLFELGADSLHIFQIAARAGRAGLPVTAQQVMRQPSVAALCSQPLAASKPDAVSMKQPLRRVSREQFKVTSDAV